MSRSKKNEGEVSFMQLASRYYNNSKRLLFKSTRKPKRKELMVTSRIVALGILFIGFVGFIIHNIITFLIQATAP